MYEVKYFHFEFLFLPDYKSKYEKILKPLETTKIYLVFETYFGISLRVFLPRKERQVAKFKGQLTSKCPHSVTLLTKIATKLLSGFLPYYIQTLTIITLLFWSKRCLHEIISIFTVL